MRVCGKNVFNELEPSKIRKVLLSTNFKDQEIIKKIKDNNIKYVLTDPKLMDKITPIPTKYWQKAVFTEGRFKKRTREAILNYWKNKKI